MKSVGVEKKYMNIKEWFSSIGREVAELVGPALVGGEQNDSIIELGALEVEKHESGYRKDLEKMLDYSRNKEKTREKGNGKGKGKGKGKIEQYKDEVKGKGETEQAKAKVQNPTGQTSRQTRTKSQEKTNEGYEQEL